MKKRVVWQPHVEPDLLLNPFVPPERRQKSARVALDEAHRGEILVGEEGSASTARRPEEC